MNPEEGPDPPPGNLNWRDTVCSLRAYYKVTKEEILDMTDDEIMCLMDGLPGIQMQNNYQLAQLEATLLNALGGKGDGKQDTPAAKLWTALERLNPFARPAWIERLGKPTVSGGPFECSPGQAQALLLALKHKQMPSWCLQIMGKVVTQKELVKLSRG